MDKETLPRKILEWYPLEGEEGEDHEIRGCRRLQQELEKGELTGERGGEEK